MAGYKGERISIPEMLDEVMQLGFPVVDARLQIQHAIEDGVLIFVNGSGRSLSAAELSSDIAKLASAFAARLRGERVSPGEMSWQMYLRDVWTSRDLFARVFNFKQGLPDTSLVQQVRRGGPKPKYHWDLIETEFTRLMDYHGDFDPVDPDWNAQARLEEALGEFCQKNGGHEPATATLRDRLAGWLQVWRLRKLGGA